MKAKNYWVGQTVKKIPIGLRSDANPDLPIEERVAWIRFPEINGKAISDSILVAGGTGSGKTVTSNVIEYFLQLERPIIDFDWTGADSHLLRMPNSKPKFLPPFTHVDGIKGLYLYYNASGGRVKRNYEVVVRPNLAKYNQAQLEAIGFSVGAAKYLKNIIHRYGPFKNLEVLYQFIEHFPYNDTKSKRVRRDLKRGKLKLRHPRIYRANDTINAQSQESIKKVLPGLIEKKVFQMKEARRVHYLIMSFRGSVRKVYKLHSFKQAVRWKKSARLAGFGADIISGLDYREGFDFFKSFLEGKNMIFSFNDKDVARVEINYWMEKIAWIRRRFPDSPRYFVKIEEAHKVLETKKTKIDDVIEEFILVCRKLNVGLLLVMPTVMMLSKKVLADIKNIISGKFKGENANILISVMGDRAKVIPYLRYNRYRGEREMLVHNQDYETSFRCKPFDCPSEITHEV